MDIPERDHVIVDPCRRARRQFAPARSDIDPVLLEPPQQRHRIGGVEIFIIRLGTDLAVIVRENFVRPARRQKKKRAMPIPVKPEIAGIAPRGRACLDPSQPFGRAILHLENMCDRMRAPDIVGNERDRAAAGALGLVIGAALLEPEGMTAERKTVTRHGFVPRRDRPRDEIVHPLPRAEIE